MSALLDIFWPKRVKAAHNVQPGEAWELRRKSDDPFPPKEYKPVRVLEVRDGWVRYYLGEFFPDERMKLDSFTYCYQKAT